MQHWGGTFVNPGRSEVPELIECDLMFFCSGCRLQHVFEGAILIVCHVSFACFLQASFADSSLHVNVAAGWSLAGRTAQAKEGKHTQGSYFFGARPPVFTLTAVSSMQCLWIGQERRKEGRTCHTKSSKTAITIASLALSDALVSPRIICLACV